jgi:hypothetical protein
MRFVFLSALVLAAGWAGNLSIFKCDGGVVDGDTFSRSQVCDIDVIDGAAKVVIIQTKNPCLFLAEETYDPAWKQGKNKLVIYGKKDKFGYYKNSALTYFMDTFRPDLGRNLKIHGGKYYTKTHNIPVVQVLGDSPACLDYPTEETWILYEGVQRKAKFVKIGEFHFHIKP